MCIYSPVLLKFTLTTAFPSTLLSACLPRDAALSGVHYRWYILYEYPVHTGARRGLQARVTPDDHLLREDGGRKGDYWEINLKKGPSTISV